MALLMIFSYSGVLYKDHDAYLIYTEGESIIPSN